MNNPADLVTPKLIELCKNLPYIVICGYTKTGKITIAKKLARELNRELIISDDYKFQDYGDNFLQAFMTAVDSKIQQRKPIIAEGVLCFRLLRKTVQMNGVLPDLIIKTECDEQTIRYFYNKDNESHKVEKALSFNKGLNTIWNDYLTLLEQNPRIKKPKIIQLNTSLSYYGL